MTGDERWRWAALGGVLGPAAFVAAWVVGGARTDGYDPTRDAISRLAAVDADTRALMTAGFVAFSVGVVVAAVALRRAVAGRCWLAVAATGVATFGVALTPLERSPRVDTAHGVAAGLGYAAFVTAAALAVAPLRRAGHGGLSVGSAVAAAVGATALVLTTVVALDGAAQRTGLTVLDVWLVALSWSVLTRRVGPVPCRA